MLWFEKKFVDRMVMMGMESGSWRVETAGSAWHFEFCFHLARASTRSPHCGILADSMED